MTDAAREPGPTVQRVVALLLVAVGAGLRVHGFSDHALWIDEYGTAWAVAGRDWGALWDRVLAVQGQSPFYYALVRLSESALGSGILALRLPSLLCGIALLPLALPLARSVFRDRQIALAVLAVLALNERLVFYSQEARPYALALLCTAVCFWCFLRVLDGRGGRAAWLAWIASSAAVVYAHYLFGVALAVQALYLAWRGPGAGRSWGSWIGGGAVLALLCAPGAVQLLALFGRRESLDWVGHGGGGVLGVLAGYLDLPVLAASGLAALCAAWAGAGFRRPAAGSHPGLVVLWLLLPFGITAALPDLLGVNLAHRRYLLVALPAVALLTGLLLALPARGRALRWLPLVVFACGAVWLHLLPPYQSYGLFSERYWTERWDLAAAALLKSQRPGEPILYQTNLVELDAVVRGEASPPIVEFTTWPLAAHFPPPRRAALVALPFSDTPEMSRVLEDRLDAAARRPRTWVVGMQPAIGRVATQARRQPGLEIAAHQRFGKVHLLLLLGKPG